MQDKSELTLSLRGSKQHSHVCIRTCSPNASLTLPFVLQTKSFRATQRVRNEITLFRFVNVESVVRQNAAVGANTFVTCNAINASSVVSRYWLRTLVANQYEQDSRLSCVRG